MQEEKIKNIISLYTRIPAETIGRQTMIGRSAVTSSILLHRMYADLAKEGFETTGYWEISNYGMLLDRVNALQGPDKIAMNEPVNISPDNFPLADKNPVGIDIEEVVNFPPAVDFREDKFYTMYFSASEIAYCILQPLPMVSFAGLFAAKEAIVKANMHYKNVPFHTIVIDHLPDGKPIHPDFTISISHIPQLAIAIALQNSSQSPFQLMVPGANPAPAVNNTLLYVISFSAIILAIISFVIMFLKH